MKLYFITRTYPSLDNGGGGIIRLGTITYLKDLGYDVWIIAPCTKTNKPIIDYNNKQILIPFVKNKNLKLFFQHFGFIEDYLSDWAQRAYSFVQSIIRPEDILFVTSGGEIGTLILGSLIKDTIGSKLIINLHDPISYATINGEFTYKGNVYHVNRDHIECKHLSKCDLVITSSLTYKDSLQKKYPLLSDKIECNYFGYINSIKNIARKKFKSPLNIVYGGAFGKFQSPEILAEAVSNTNNVIATFIGDYRENKKLHTYINHSNINFINKMSQSDYINYIIKYADVGFLSLKGSISNFCIPSKLYEYINVGLPILATIKGDAKDIIEKNGYGIVSDYKKENLIKSINFLKDKITYENCVNNVLLDRDKWSMKHTIKDLDMLIRRP